MPAALLAGIGAAAGAGGNIVSSVTDFGQTRRTQNRNYKLNERAAENAYARQLEQWNRQNEYNNPVNSYRRELQGLRDNDLSPGLLYSGAGGAGGGAATDASAPAGSGSSGSGAMSRPPLDFAGAFQAAQGLKESQSRIDLNRSTAAKADAEAGLVPSQNALIKSQTELATKAALSTEAQTTGQLLANELSEATLPQSIEQARVDLQTSVTLLDQYIEQAQQATINTQFARDTYDSRVEAVHQDIALKSAQIILTYCQAEAAQAGVTLTDAQIAAQLATNTFLPRMLRAQFSVLVNQGNALSAGIESTQATTGLTKVRTIHEGKKVNWFNANQVSDLISTTIKTFKPR